MPTDPFLAILSGETIGITGVPYSDIAFYGQISPLNAVTPTKPSDDSVSWF